MAETQRILVPTDFSDPARHALEWAVDFARQTGAQLHVIYVRVLHEDDPITAEEQFPKQVPESLNDVVTSRDMVSAMAAEIGIVRTARKMQADLIILGTHGRSGFSHVLLGSVAERVVRLADCPVITVPPPDRDRKSERP